jgi:hypothetical protein
MKGIGSSLLFALGNLLHPRMLWLMVWPVLVAMLAWGVVAVIVWAQAVLWLAGLLQQWVEYATIVVPWDSTAIATFAAKVILLLALVPLIQLTALLILSIWGMPAMVEHVAERRFASLGRKRGGSLAGSLWNSALALAGLVLLGLVTLPLWVIPPLWPLIPVAIMAWVNQRVLRYDALAEHASAEEMRQILAARRGALYLLGLVLALLAYIPLLGFFAPVMVGLTFIHDLLAALKSLREAPIEGRMPRL